MQKKILILAFTSIIWFFYVLFDALFAFDYFKSNIPVANYLQEANSSKTMQNFYFFTE